MRISVSASSIDASAYIPILQQRRAQDQQGKKVKKKKKKSLNSGGYPLEEFLVFPPVRGSISLPRKLKASHPKRTPSPMRISPVNISADILDTNVHDDVESQVIFPSVVPQPVESNTVDPPKPTKKKKKQDSDYKEPFIKKNPKSQSNRTTNPYICKCDLLLTPYLADSTSPI